MVGLVQSWQGGREGGESCSLSSGHRQRFRETVGVCVRPQMWFVDVL